MASLRLKHVERWTDRTGRVRYYHRRGKGKRTPLPGDPGSPEFMAAYTAAEAAQKPAQTRGEPGTLDRLAADYYRSAAFLRLRPSTRSNFRRAMDALLREQRVGHRLVADMRREHVEIMVGSVAHMPGKAIQRLKRLKTLLSYAVACGWRADNPAYGVKAPKGGSIHSWTDDELAAFEARWPVGTLQRTAYALHLYTGQRRSDVARMTWADATGGTIRVKQMKTGAELTIPQHPDLQRALAATPRAHVVILATVYGAARSIKAYGGWFKDAIRAAGLPERCTSHGLRKAAARLLAEAGCSAREIMAITGHASLTEVERYTRAVDQGRLARDAIARLRERNPLRIAQTDAPKIPNAPKRKADQ